MKAKLIEKGKQKQMVLSWKRSKYHIISFIRRSRLAVRPYVKAISDSACRYDGI